MMSDFEIICGMGSTLSQGNDVIKRHLAGWYETAADMTNRFVSLNDRKSIHRSDDCRMTHASSATGGLVRRLFWMAAVVVSTVLANIVPSNVAAFGFLCSNLVSIQCVVSQASGFKFVCVPNAVAFGPLELLLWVALSVRADVGKDFFSLFGVTRLRSLAVVILMFGVIPVVAFLVGVSVTKIRLTIALLAASFAVAVGAIFRVLISWKAGQGKKRIAVSAALEGFGHITSTQVVLATRAVGLLQCGASLTGMISPAQAA